jgi:putative ABC transport system ATP-binding protein
MKQAIPNTVVHCKGVTKEFDSGTARVKALRHVDLEIPLGQVTLLVGPSGCGKTTLLSVVAGILEPTAGTVEVLGVDLSQLKGRDKVQFRGAHIGFVFQQFNLIPELTAVENAALTLIIAGWKRRTALSRARDMLAELGLAHRADAFPSQLSGGEQQRVAIARAVVHEPQLLVCDEPTSALDGRTGRAIMDLLRSVALQPGRAVVIVTHDNRVLPYGDRIARMEDGRVIQVEPGNGAAVTHAEYTVQRENFTSYPELSYET